MRGAPLRQNAVLWSALIAMGAVLLLLLVGCAGVERQPEAGKPLALSADTALVFGRIVVAEDGLAIPTGGQTGLTSEATIFRLDDGREMSIPVENDGSFYFVVPQGTYMLARIDGRFDPHAAFRVPGGAGAYYLGLMRIDVKVEGTDPKKTYIMNRVRVENQFAASRQALSQRFPNVAGSAEVSLLAQSDELPGYAAARARLQDQRQAQSLLFDVTNVLRALSIH